MTHERLEEIALASRMHDRIAMSEEEHWEILALARRGLEAQDFDAWCDSRLGANDALRRACELARESRRMERGLVNLASYDWDSLAEELDAALAAVGLPVEEK